jgi:hypothetical protein
MDYIEIKDEDKDKIGECLICFNLMNKKKDELIFCNYCSTYIHKKCFDLWTEQNIKKKNNCIYCQQIGKLKKKNTSFFYKIKNKCCFNLF